MLYAIVAVLALILDQAVKYWTTVNIVETAGRATLIPGFIHLSNVHNTGAAFSFLEGARWFFVVLCLLFVLLVVYALAKDLITHPVCRWSAVMVMAGAIGNCIDRIVCGYVVDMLEFDFLFFKRPFPVFNIADIYITLGVIVFCVALLLEKPAGKKKTAGAAPADAPEAEKAPKAKAAKRSPFRRRTKIQIPQFEKHEMPEVPAMDPNDPFAEWEKQAKAARPAAPSQPAAPAQPHRRVYTQPEAQAPSAAPKAPAAPPAPKAPVPPKAPESPAPSAEKPAAEDFDLDSILAEFKDL